MTDPVHVIDTTLDSAGRLGERGFATVVRTAEWLTTELYALGVPTVLQVVFLALAGLALVLLLAEMFGGLIRTAAIVLLLLVTLHVLLPMVLIHP